MTKEINHLQGEELRMELDAYKKAAPEIARAMLITQAARRYLHEVDNQMLFLSALLSRLFKLKSVREDKEAIELVHRITNDFEILQDIIRSFASWFKTPRERHARPLSECVRQVTDMFKINLLKINLDIALDIAIDEVSGQTLVPDEIIKVSITNLVQNSLDALRTVRRNGHIRIKTAKTEGCIKLTVEDDGPGISPEILPTIGRPFFATRPNRMGLGLCLVKLMLQRVGGEISIGNRDPHGTKVVLTVPLNWREFLNEKNPMD